MSVTRISKSYAHREQLVTNHPNAQKS